LLVTPFSPHPKALARLFTLKVLQIRKRTPTVFPSIVFTFGLEIESIKEFGGATVNPLMVNL